MASLEKQKKKKQKTFIIILLFKTKEKLFYECYLKKGSKNGSVGESIT